MNEKVLPRLVAGSLADRLRAMPAVVVTGARQTGKSTLVRELTPGRLLARIMHEHPHE